MNTWATGLPEGRPTLFLALLAGALTPNKQENEGSQVLPSAGPERPNRPAQDQRRKHGGMRGDREGSHQPRTPTASHYFRPETNDRKQTAANSAPSSPNPASQPFGSGVVVVARVSAASAPSSGPGGPLLAPGLPGSAAPGIGRASTPGAARATREDGGRRGTAPPALATGQAQRHLSVLQSAVPTPRSRFRGDSGRGTLRSPLGRKKKSKKKTKTNKKITKTQKALPATVLGLPARRLTRASQAASPRPSGACSGLGRVLRRASRPADNRYGRPGLRHDPGPDEAQGAREPGTASAPASPTAPASLRGRVRRERGNRPGANGSGLSGRPRRLPPLSSADSIFFFLPREARKRDSPPQSLGGGEWERRTEGVCGAARGGDWEKLIFLARPPSLQALPRPLLAAPPRRRPPLAEPRSLLRGSPGGSGGRNTHTRAHTLGAHN